MEDFFGVIPENVLNVKSLLGFLPISVWKPDRRITKQLKKIVGDTGQLRTAQESLHSFLPIGRRPNGVLPFASVFNPHLAIMILSAYCPKNAKIYDPFAGGGTRAYIASAMDFEYWGVELRKEEVDRVILRGKELGLGNINILCQDSSNYLFDADIFDFSYTCPPYYNLEKYSDLGADLSNLDDYSTFLSVLKKCMIGVYTSLKLGSFSIWVVGNFRDKIGNLCHFSGDTIRLGMEIGFNLHDELIFWGAPSFVAKRAGQFSANKKSVRVHEYIIIFRK